MAASTWPKGAQVAISFTCDNLGEAQEINSGVWPTNVAPGTHWSVLKVLPNVLQTLERHGVKATFFFETWSIGIYGAVTKDVVERGHEIAWHGWQHENWTQLSAHEERDVFSRSFSQAQDLGCMYKGFRPPGGLINEQTGSLLHKYGVRYISPAAERASVENGLAILPFQWEAVDAFYYMDQFSNLRQQYNVQRDSLGPDACLRGMLDLVERAVESNAYVSVLFHPILQDSSEKLAVFEEVVNRVAHDPRIWCAPCYEVADWVLENRDKFSSNPGWPKATW
ncbi:hypothetical protein M409DRAFT_66769 [Zasmidium cellare ATCC 36951]|uniref:NodB homology domain-containing protein n=1 Tax=Zasmidium cellare ATCC 36951 TaxID=1080233 RepID=A0A6A6CJI3_ZASCE|nr:uncharacterized protein M409DRAFT_66769 [Zasmidium cellare ATCC 36951]KAF2166310.1 hypothetical protein M409DRAFT_66769 [Zasmidium cellare ATCC 36951]